MAGKPWYNNGIKEIQIGPNEVIPDGYVRGRLPLTQQQKQQRTNKFLATMNQKSEQELDAINQKRSNTLKKTFSQQDDSVKQQTIEKRKETMMNKSDEEKVAYRQKLSQASKGKNKGYTPWNKGLTKETDERVAKNSLNTSLGVRKHNQELLDSDPEYFKNWRSHINDVMRQNHTFNTSQPEEKYYQQLVDKYGVEDVVRFYSDDRYPFICDFYIPSEDLFIEYNGTWTHGGHPFDENNLDDIFTLEQWQEKAKTSQYYQNAIYTWTVLDVRKQKIAKENHLNYMTIYK